MKVLRVFVAILTACALACPVLIAQDKSPGTVKVPASLLKLQVTIVEREGDKKVANLPYTFFLNAAPINDNPPRTKLRTGSRVPVYTGKEGGMQYIDVGTNIDARGVAVEDGRFNITLFLERSWVAGEVEVPLQKTDGVVAESGSTQFKEPIIRQFKIELDIPMRDGQTSEVTQAADPISSRILTISVTMNVMK